MIAESHLNSGDICLEVLYFVEESPDQSEGIEIIKLSDLLDVFPKEKNRDIK